MLLRTPALSASVVVVLAICVAATPTRPYPISVEGSRLPDYGTPHHPSPPASPPPPPSLPPPPHVPKPYSGDKLKLEGVSYTPPPSKPYPGKPKHEEKPYALPPPPLPLPALPSPLSKEKPGPYEKPYSSSPPPKSYPEKPKKPYLSLSPPQLEEPKPEKKPEEKYKPYDKPKSNEKTHPPPSPQRPYTRGKDEPDKAKNQASQKDENGCSAGKCRRIGNVTCDDHFLRSRFFLTVSQRDSPLQSLHILTEELSEVSQLTKLGGLGNLGGRD